MYTCTGANVRTLNGAAAAAAFPRDLCGNVVMGVAGVIGGCRHIEISAGRVEPVRRSAARRGARSYNYTK